MIETGLIIIAFVIGMAVMRLAINFGEKEQARQLSPQEEAQFELEPVYAVATITETNVGQVMEAAMLHAQDPDKYPPVPAVEARKRENHETDEQA